MGKEALYFYSILNAKTLVGKSTKIRLYYRDLKAISKLNTDAITVELETVRQVGQDLRSDGTSKYKTKSSYTLSKIADREECLN